MTDTTQAAGMTDFKQWLNERRGLPVAEVFHEIVAKYSAALAAQATQAVGLTEREIGECIDEVNASSEYAPHQFGWCR